jgi:glycerol-3-phosphate acyltransferase PlsY
MSVLLLLRHRDNICNLIKGQERRFGMKKGGAS